MRDQVTEHWVKRLRGEADPASETADTTC